MGIEAIEAEFVENDIVSDDDAPDEAHNKLLNAVSQLYKKQRINAPKRREPAQEISEFNLSSNTETTNNKVFVNELLKDLKEKVTHKEINTKVKAAQKKSKTLPKPLEKIEADKISREVGYQNVQKKLDKWNSIVERNKLADQLVFPLIEHKQVEMEAPNFLKTFKEPSELEKAMAAVLNRSEIAQEERKVEESLNNLSIEEMIERRKMMAKMRARESYRIAKAVRQNKIKSKKYHRILKKERIKQELKDFEKLQKTDPEAALAKLEQIERARAEERISLRHRNTGKWARSRAIRAKYDTEARVQLAEQLAKSRELTRKLNMEDSSSSEGEMEDQEHEEDGDRNIPPKNATNSDSSNPWVKETVVDEFLSGYKQFWSKKNELNHNNRESSKEENSHEIDSGENLNNNLSVTRNEIGFCSESFTDNQNRINNGLDGSESIDTLRTHKVLLNTEKSNDDSCSKQSMLPEGEQFTSPCESKLNLPEVTISEPSNNDTISSEDTIPKDINGTNNAEILNKHEVTKRSSPNNISKRKEPVTTLPLTNKPDSNSPHKYPSNKKKEQSSSLVDFTNTECKPTKRSKKFPSSNDNTINKRNWHTTSADIPVKDSCSESSNVEISDTDSQAGTSSEIEVKVDQKAVLTTSGTWSVMDDTKKNKNPKRQVKLKRKPKDKTISEIFDDAEEAIQNHTSDMVEKIKLDLLNEPEKSSSKVEKIKMLPNPTSKKVGKNHGIDEALIEMHEEGISSGISDIKNIKDKLNSSENTFEKEPQIDPNKHINVKPQKLFSEIGDLEEAGNDSDEETTQKMHLMEAFADDDIAEQFRKEKNEEAKKNKAEEINLELPGWGSWGGCSIQQKTRRKRRRFIVKMPKIPRKDEKKEHVIINEDPVPKLREQLVNELPYPFTSVKDYEASIRAPIGKHWVPEKAHSKLIAPPVITKLGTIIEPMNENMVLSKNLKKRRKLK